MSSSAVAVAARAAVASAICVGAITARARLRDERSGRFAFAEARGESDEDALTQLDIFAPCVLEAIGTFLVALSILITADPFRDARAVVKHVTLQSIRGGNFRFFSPRTASGRRASSDRRRRETPFDAFAEDLHPPALDRTPRMTPALDALVTDADVEHFLRELASAPTEREAEEAMAREDEAPERWREDAEEEVMSGGDARLRGGSGRSGETRARDDASGDARRRAGVEAATAAALSAGWSVLARGDTGNGTTFRLLKRNEPAPGTAAEGRRGLTQFRLEMVMEGVSAEQLARVQMNDVIRGEWDTSLVVADHLARSDAETYDVSTDMNAITDAEDNDAGEGSELAFWRMKFPAPLAPRDYLFVRRRWRCARGAYYGVTKDATGSRDGDALLEQLGPKNGSGLRVRRIFSGQRVRDVASNARRPEDETPWRNAVPPSPANSTTSASGGGDASGGGNGGDVPSCTGAAELVSVYHEDSGVPAAVICLGACKGLMPYMRNLEEAARGGRFAPGASGAFSNAARVSFDRQRHVRVRRRLFGKDGVAASFWPLRRFNLARGDSASRWFPRRADATGENSVGGHRPHGVRSTLSRIKRSLIHRTAHRRAPGHDHVRAEGRRRRLMVRAAGLVALASRIAKNR